MQSIEPLDELEEVFCILEPKTHAFVLGNGLLTGNCAYIAIDDPRAFDEAMYISMCGTGVGFSVERQYVNQLPIIAEKFYDTDTVIKVKDSKIGWASAFPPNWFHCFTADLFPNGIQAPSAGWFDIKDDGRSC